MHAVSKSSSLSQFGDYLEPASCVVCGNSDYDVLRPAHYPEEVSLENFVSGYRSSSDQTLMDQLVRCLSCGMVYLNPRVKSEIIFNGYSSAVDPVFFEQNEMRIRTFRAALQKFMRRFNVKPDSSKSVLDIGCGGGAFPKAAFDLGFSVTGIEPGKWLCEEGRKRYNLDLRPGVLSDYSFDSSSFDLVTLWDVIEHLTAPAQVLEEIHRILKNDGYLLVNYPDHASLARRLLGKKWPFYLNVHLYYFEPGTLSTLLQKCGFEVIERRTYWQTLELGYVMQRATPYIPSAGIAAKLIRLLRCHRFPVTYNMGQSLVVAVKR